MTIFCVIHGHLWSFYPLLPTFTAFYPHFYVFFLTFSYTFLLQGTLQPYCSLMQLDDLASASSALVGCNNQIIKESKLAAADVVLDVRHK